MYQFLSLVQFLKARHPKWDKWPVKSRRRELRYWYQDFEALPLFKG